MNKSIDRFRVRLCVRIAMAFMISLFAMAAAGGMKVRASEEGTASVAEAVELSDYKEISQALSDYEGCFGTMTVENSDGGIVIDGVKGSLAEEFDAQKEEAKEAASSKAALRSFLEKHDEERIYHVESDENGDMEVTAPYQTKRLIIDALVEDDTMGASRVYYNTADKETILEFDTEEETKLAYEAAVKRYGKKDCFVDKIFYCEDLFGTGASSELPPAANSVSWGNVYMKSNSLKSQAAALGYRRQVKVAVIDTGVNKFNPLFAGNRIVKESWNFMNGTKNVTDTFGHGSHVSGIIADATPANVKILALKVTDSEGEASLYTLRTAMRYAVDQGVDVINMSMGVNEEFASIHSELDSIIRKAYYKGIPTCVSAGNGGFNTIYNYPANLTLPIVVAAINKDGSRGHASTPKNGVVYYSNYGSTIDFAAPGTAIVSAVTDSYNGTMTGTSMAAPHVAAAIAYIKMMQPDISVSSVENQLRSMSRDLGLKGKDRYFGYGCPIIGSLFTEGLKYTEKVAPVTGKAEITKLSNKKDGIKISWKKASKAEKYGIYRKTVTGSYARIATVSKKKQSYLDKKASSGKKYVYMVKGFRYDIAGPDGTAKTIRRMKNVSKIKVRKKTKKTLALSWKKGKKATGYEIRYSSSKSMKKKTLVAVVKNKATLKGLKGKYCYYQIRACSRDGAGSYHSAWSRKQKVKLR